MDGGQIAKEHSKPRAKKAKAAQGGGKGGEEAEETRPVRLKDYVKHLFDKKYEENIEKRVQE